MNLSDIGDSPFGNSLPASLKPALTDLSQTFDTALTSGFAGSPVKIIDTYALFKTAYQNPGRYGFVNNTVPACDAAKISVITGGAVTDGSSLFCNSTAGVPYNGLRSRRRCDHLAVRRRRAPDSGAATKRSATSSPVSWSCSAGCDSDGATTAAKQRRVAGGRPDLRHQPAPVAEARARIRMPKPWHAARRILAPTRLGPP